MRRKFWKLALVVVWGVVAGCGTQDGDPADPSDPGVASYELDGDCRCFGHCRGTGSGGIGDYCCDEICDPGFEPPERECRALGDSCRFSGGCCSGFCFQDQCIAPPTQFFEHVAFQGESLFVPGTLAFVGWDWNDRISSVLVPAGVTLVIYEHADFQGNSLTLVDPGVVDLADFGFADSVSSIWVY